MKKIITLLFLYGVLMAFNSLYASSRWYVDASRPDDSGDGAGWGTAKKTIAAAAALGVDYDSILVKGGNYTFSANWTIPQRRQYYGGFAGNENFANTARTLSDLDINGIIEPWEFTNPTILNFTNVNDNALTFPNSSIQFNGFTITHTGTLSQTKRTITLNNATANFTNNTIKNCNLTISMTTASTGAVILKTLGNVSNCLIQNNTVTVNATFDGTVELIEVASNTVIPGTKFLNSIIRNNKVTLDYSGGTSANGNARGIIVQVTPSITASVLSVMNGCIVHNNEVTFTGNGTNATMNNGSFVATQNTASSVGDSIINNVIANNKALATSGYTFNPTGLKFFCGNSAPHFALNNACWNNTNSAGTVSNIATNGTVAAGLLSYNYANGGSLTNSGLYITNNDATLASTNTGTNPPYFISPTTTIGNTTDNSSESSVWAISTSSYLKGKGTSTNRSRDKADVSFTSPRSVGAYEFIYFRSNATGDWNSNAAWHTSPDNTTWNSTISNPSRTSAASISIQPTHHVTITANATASALTVNAGGKLTLNSGKTLNATSLTLENSSAGCGTFVDNGGTLTVTTATAQQNLAVARNWYMSSPVSGAVSLPTVNTGTLMFYAYPENDANQATGANGYAAGGVWNTISTGTLVIGAGYIVQPSVTSSTVTFSGTSFNTGNKTITGLTYSASNPKSGFNLIGNPYPSYLNVLPAINTNSNLEPTVWYRTRDTNETPLYHFETVNTTTGVGTNASGTGRVTGYIPPMQSFWVRTAVNNQSITLNNTERSHATTVNMTGFGTVPTTTLKAPRSESQPYSLLGLYITNGSVGDETILMFTPKASNSLDCYDSKKLSNNNASIPEIYTTISSDKLVINGMNSVPETEIPLGFTTGKAGNLTLKASEISNFDNNTRIYLRDKQENAEIELTPETEYAFSTTTATTNNESRFSLLFKAPGVTTATGNPDKERISVFINTQNQITIIAPEKCNYTIYNATGQQIENGFTNNKLYTINYKLTHGVYVVKVNNQSTRVIIK